MHVQSTLVLVRKDSFVLAILVNDKIRKGSRLKPRALPMHLLTQTVAVGHSAVRCLRSGSASHPHAIGGVDRATSCHSDILALN